jgi:hypothetical protein
MTRDERQESRIKNQDAGKKRQEDRERRMVFQPVPRKEGFNRR